MLDSLFLFQCLHFTVKVQLIYDRNMPTFINNAASVFICNKRFFIEAMNVIFLKSVDYANVIFLFQNSAGVPSGIQPRN